MISNHWGRAATVRLEAPETCLVRARHGRGYHHHQHLLAVGERVYACFSSGTMNEDDVGQEVHLAVSEDAGQTWSAPRCVAAPRHDREVLTTGGLHAWTKPGRGHPMISLLYGTFSYRRESLVDGHRAHGDASHEDTATFVSVSGDGGETWTSPALAVPRFVPNMDPSPLACGRLVMPGSVVYPWTDDATARTGWQWSAVPGLPRDHVDDSAGFAGIPDRQRFGYCEGSFFQTDDGVVHMMLRTNGPRLAVTESHDRGETWSPVAPTDFSDNASRHHFGRLPDGRFFALSTPDPENRWQRTPLVLALSHNGRDFDRHFVLGDEPAQPPRLSGLHKVGRFGYPHLALAGDHVVVLYSVAKEDVACRRFPLSALG